MNTDDLRWILTGCGVILVVGIYSWDRLKRKFTDKWDPDIRSVGNPPADGFSLRAEADVFDGELELPSMRVAPFDTLFTEAADPEIEPEFDETNTTDLPEPNDLSRIVQIKVTAHNASVLRGAMLIDALRAAGLEYGAMNIFHKRQNRSQAPLFSVVNMVEPGTFPVNDPGHFQSSGVIFFLQVGLCDQPLSAFDEMIRTAHMFAAEVGGQVLDAENQLLTVDKTESIRESLVPVAG